MRKFLMLLAVLFGAGLFMSGAVLATSEDEGEECAYDSLVGSVYEPIKLVDVDPDKLRVMTPDTPIEMGEHVPGRVNVLIDGETNIVMAVHCE